MNLLLEVWDPRFPPRRMGRSCDLHIWFFYWEKNGSVAICGKNHNTPPIFSNSISSYFFIFVYNPMPPHCRNFQWIGDVSWWFNEVQCQSDPSPLRNVGLTASFQRWHCSCAINVIVCHCQSSLNQSKGHDIYGKSPWKNVSFPTKPLWQESPQNPMGFVRKVPCFPGFSLFQIAEQLPTSAQGRPARWPGKSSAWPQLLGTGHDWHLNASKNLWACLKIGELIPTWYQFIALMGKIWENDDQPLDLGGFPQDVQTKPWRSKHFKANWDCSHQIAPMFELHWSSFSTYKWLIQNDLWHEIQVQDLVGFAGEHVGGIRQKEWEVFRMPALSMNRTLGQILNSS